MQAFNEAVPISAVVLFVLISAYPLLGGLLIGLGLEGLVEWVAECPWLRAPRHYLSHAAHGLLAGLLLNLPLTLVVALVWGEAGSSACHQDGWNAMLCIVATAFALGRAHATFSPTPPLAADGLSANRTKK